MRFRKLRIAWSVAWGVVGVLLCVLWARSYCRQWEVVRVFLSSHYRYDLLARQGCVEVTKHYSGTIAFDLGFDSAPFKRDYLGIRPSILGFRRIMDGNSQQVNGFAVPYWFPTVLCIVAAIAPWIRLQKKFSIRVMLLAVTLLVLLLTLISFSYHHAKWLEQMR